MYAFSDLIAWDNLTDLVWGGQFNQHWSRTYSRCAYGHHPDNGGSGWTISSVLLKPITLLPVAVQLLDNGQNGFVYLIVSPSFRVAYVGMTKSSLREGLFGRAGRFLHHARKMLAAHYPSTNHVLEWQSHAIDRHSYVAKQPIGQPRQPDLSDIYIALLQTDDPKAIEAAVLDILVGGVGPYRLLNKLSRKQVQQRQFALGLGGKEQVKGGGAGAKAEERKYIALPKNFDDVISLPSLTEC